MKLILAFLKSILRYEPGTGYWCRVVARSNQSAGAKAMANKMVTKSKPAKKEVSKDGPPGPGMMPHKGGKDCRCPHCKDKRK